MSMCDASPPNSSLVVPKPASPFHAPNNSSIRYADVEPRASRSAKPPTPRYSRTVDLRLAHSASPPYVHPTRSGLPVSPGPAPSSHRPSRCALATGRPVAHAAASGAPTDPSVQPRFVMPAHGSHPPPKPIGSTSPSHSDGQLFTLYSYAQAGRDLNIYHYMTYI